MFHFIMYSYTYICSYNYSCENGSVFILYVSFIQLDMTPLHCGAKNNHVLVVEALIKAKADVNAIDDVSKCV